MGSVGDACDNAMAESFFATLECELLDRRRLKTQAEARMAVLRIHRGLLQAALIARISVTITFERQYAATALSNPVHTSMRRARARQVKERPASVMASCIASVPAVLC
jgi:hypothetical protein